jgi:putative acyl-CoA dehydrogenase
MSDAFLTLAHTGDRGVSCFVVPRWLPDGSQNFGFQLQRLKEKLGDKSNASSEVEYRDAIGYLLGEEGRGVRTIVDMVVHTRLDCVIGSAALMRQCSQLATHHCTTRSTFGKRLIEQPLMRAVLADLALESESAMALWMRLASSLDRASQQAENEGKDDGEEDGDENGEEDSKEKREREREHEIAFVRLATAVSKYWVCKRAPTVAYEAMEVHGGNGYVEEGPMAALYRQSPLNAIWEGSGNVICLDVLRAIAREPESLAALFHELEKSIVLAREIGANSYEEMVLGVKEELRRSDMCSLEMGARSLVDRLALCLSASVLMQDGDGTVASCYVRTRMPVVGCGGVVPTSNVGSMAGALLESSEMNHLIDRMRVECR